MWIIRKFPKAWGIYNDETFFSRLLENDEIAMIKLEFPQLHDDAVIMITVPEIDSISPENRSPEFPGLPDPDR